MRQSLEVSKNRSTKKDNTFGTPYSRYAKAVVEGATDHYYGQGNINQNGIGIQEYDLAMKHVKNTTHRVAYQKEDRGLLSPSKKQLANAVIGPGTYTYETQ